MGKSDVAFELSAILPVEIISADAIQVYKGLDAASAKPGKKIQAKIKHHLIDIVELHETYSAGRFVQDAQDAIQDVLERNKIPLIVGGTMFYIKALLYGLDNLPQANKTIRAKYLSLIESKKEGSLYKALYEVDPIAAQRIGSGDQQRLLRALEIYEQTGETASSLYAKSSKQGLKQICKAVNFSGKIISVALMFKEREILYRRIATRFNQFIANGLIEEVKKLRDFKYLSLEHPAIRAPGYRQVWEYMAKHNELQHKNEKQDAYNHMLEKAVIATRHLAKKQLTWLRSWDNIEWLDASLPSKEVAKKITELID